MGQAGGGHRDVHFLDPEDEIYRHILLNTKGFGGCGRAQSPLLPYHRTKMLGEFSYLG